ncbi:hypothetical protein QN277_006632 [Acacia crassicarpa]|uniref:30S ribosomal protein S21, chloroplastic n=1 Tax=Acacia crassicarpa TaxID=499986 RepID=A0AAE1ITA3_9FABA|nr:hypothetical protein QN277_006632 [Acacia crassicarpa]
MAVSFLSSFFSTLLPSKSACPCPTPTCLHCPPSQLRLQQSSSWTSDLTESSLSFPSLHARDYSPILYPALACSNILFFKSAYNVQIIVIENEPEDRLVDRFRKEVIRAGVFQECRKRRFFENQREKRKRKSREAAKKNRRRPRSRAPRQKRDEAPEKKKFDDEKDDNWGLPEVDLPYC